MALVYLDVRFEVFRSTANDSPLGVQKQVPLAIAREAKGVARL
jgi:hypothetical protein